MSSPTSTASSSSFDSDGYGAIQFHERFDSESTPLNSKANHENRDTSDKGLLLEGSHPHDRRLVWQRTRNVLVGALVGLLVVFLGRNQHRTHHSHSKKAIRIPDDHGGVFSNTKTWVESSGSYFATHSESFGLSPMDDMGMLGLERNYDALPSSVWGSHLEQEGHPLPTNSWYLNLVSQKAAYQPDDQTRVYTVPYIVDTASPYPKMQGLRIHWPYVKAAATNVQMVNDFTNALCLGAEGTSGHYQVSSGRLSHLGVGLEWLPKDHTKNAPAAMSTHVVRGMPYATMEYHRSDSESTIRPTIYSYHGLASPVTIDLETPFVPSAGNPKLVCGTAGSPGTKVTVQKHLHLHFINSDFTWMVFFSKPVQVTCTIPNGQKDPHTKDFKLSIVETTGGSSSNDGKTKKDNLVVRVALLDQCTTGHATIQQHCQERNAQKDPEGYERLLKKHAHAIPNSPTIDFEYAESSSSSNNNIVNESGENDETVAKLHIDWDATSTTSSEDVAGDDLLMFGLPHHLESLSQANDSNTTVTDYCVNSFHGTTCLVQNSKWTLNEALGTPLSFLAPRPPKAELIPAIAEYLHEDISYRLSDNTLRGAADTYFSGKVVARMARVLVIAFELKTLAEATSVEDIQELYYGDDSVTTSMIEESIRAASKVKLPSSQQLQKALEQLTTAVTVWLKSDAEAPYVYDESWGGLVNCGCNYTTTNEFGHCGNSFPDCPALSDVNEDFGNGYYNDHHYHYGYHVYAAAVVAKLDPSWGRKHFDEVMLYIRDFANPFPDDEFFPQYRSKDWFLGSSWASGIVSAENSPHGRNEESSSEAISAYEGVTLFGSAMVDAYKEVLIDMDDDSVTDDDFVTSKLETAKLIRDSGQLLTASEIQATNRYWHVWSSETHNNTYPSAYKRPVVGMLYDTMATFQTWFAPWALVSYGIQLIPLTPVTETRDNVDWAKELYPLYAEACAEAGDFCVENGWSILQAGLLATTGNYTGAVEQAKAVPPEVFGTDGGNGNSMSNTIWYIATRKDVAE